MQSSLKLCLFRTVKDFLKIEHELLHLNIQHMTIQLETAQHDHDTSVLCSGLHKEHAHH